MASLALRARLTSGATAFAIAFALGAPLAAAADFPQGSLAIGHPELHREEAVSGGIVASRIPPAASLAADQLLVESVPGVLGRLEKLIRVEPGVRLIGALPDLPVDLLRVAPVDRARVVAWLRAQSGVESVQADVLEYPDGVACPAGGDCPNDPGFPYQWYLDNAPGNPVPPTAGAPVEGADVDAPLAWSQSRGSPDVRIAIVDSGIDSSQPDLAGKVVAAANFTASDTVADLAGHGTHVAGIAAASFDNAIGIAGMAPNAHLMDIKVLAVDANGRTTGDCADVADGIVWATNHGANVINMSLGSTSPCEAMQLAVGYAYSHGALPIAAAGNDGSTTLNYPAADQHVLSVAATTAGDQVADFSNRGAGWVDIAAPGAGIVSTLPTYDNATGAVDYGYLSGTSMAAPIVSGIAALIWAQMPAGAANRDVEARIFATAEPIAGTGVDWRYGLVDACRAVTLNAASCHGAPAPAPGVQVPIVPPFQIAQEAPIASPPSRPNALPGTYTGSLGRRGGRLRLVVGGRGDALIRVQTAVLVRCAKGPSRRVPIAVLSTSAYGKIAPGGKFAFQLRRRGVAVRVQRIRISGTFDVARRRARGTLRLTGQAPRAGRCDSRPIIWTAGLTNSAS